MTVDRLRVPSGRLESLLHILRERQTSFSFDGDVVVVVKVNEIAEAEVAGERGGLGADAFHQIAVRADRVDVVVDGREGRVRVETRGHHLRGERHADAVREPLTERSGR